MVKEVAIRRRIERRRRRDFRGWVIFWGGVGGWLGFWRFVVDVCFDSWLWWC